MPDTTRAEVRNRLLADLPRRDLERLLPHLEPVSLKLGEVLYEPGERIRHCYFPNDGVVSLLTVLDPRKAAEVGMVGREGLVGMSAAIGIKVSQLRAVVQGAGSAMRISAASLQKEFAASDSLRSESFYLTHQFLSLMIGVRRVGVTNAAGRLAKRKLISYRRGNIRIMDSKGLQAASCECYEAVKSMYAGRR